MRLRALAHLRTGDKGDTCQISVIAFDRGNYRLLEEVLTCEKVVTHFARLPIRSATRFELPHLGALLFVLPGALGGGVTRTLALDPHGKALGAQLLDIDISCNNSVRDGVELTGPSERCPSMSGDNGH